MANRWYARPFCGQKGLVILTGLVPLSSAGAVGTIDGIMFSVAKAGTGQYTFTFDDAFSKLQFGDIVLHQTTPQAFLSPNMTVGYAPTSKLWTATVTLLNTSAVATDVNNVSELHCMFAFRNFSGTR